MRAGRIAYGLVVCLTLAGTAVYRAPLDAVATLADCTVAALQAKAPKGTTITGATVLGVLPIAVVQ